MRLLITLLALTFIGLSTANAQSSECGKIVAPITQDTIDEEYVAVKMNIITKRLTWEFGTPEFPMQVCDF